MFCVYQMKFIHTHTRKHTHKHKRFPSASSIYYWPGLFMASQTRVIACGTRKAALAMAMKFLAGPFLMAVPSLALGLRGKLLKVAIVQVSKKHCLFSYLKIPLDLMLNLNISIEHNAGCSPSGNSSICLCKGV